MKTKLNFLWFLMVLPGLYGNAALAERPAGVRKLTFDQALDLTYQNSHVLKQVSYLQKQKDQERLAAKGLFFPTIGVTASAIMMSDPIELDLNPIKDAITPLYKTLGSYGKFGDVPGLTDDMATQVIRQKLNAGLGQIQNEDWNQVIQKQQFAVVAATLQWPVFTGGKILIANKSAEIQKKDVHDVSRQKEGELMSELVERYYGLCLASSVVKVRTEVSMGLQRHLEDAVKLQNQGIISNADLLQARVYSAQAGRELSKAIRNISIVTQALMSTMALEDSSMVEPVSALFYLDTIESQTSAARLTRFDARRFCNFVDGFTKPLNQHPWPTFFPWYPCRILRYDIGPCDIQNGGRGEIRTPGAFEGTFAFQASDLIRSSTLPVASI